MNTKTIKKYTNKKLFDEYVATKQQIDDIGCYGTKDVMYLAMLEDEIDRRELKIKVNYSYED